MADRYDTTGNPEDEYYPGASVLINLEDIRDPVDLLGRETELQLAAYEEMFGSSDETLTPAPPFFCYLHHMFYLDVLSARPRGDIFDWTLTDEKEYVRACVAGFGQGYDPMTALLKRCAS